MSTNTIRIVVDPSGAVSGANTASNAIRGIGGAANQTAGGLGTLGKAMGALGALAVAGGLLVLGKAILDVNTKFQGLQAQLVTATGSLESASGAFAALQDFAKRTPFSVESATKAFIQLKNLGLDPSERALMSYGNTAGAMGKTINQLVEAVADASTGEFERLKEFGIKAKVQGDKLAFTFGGVKTVIGNNSAEIQKYLINLGETKFAGGAEQQAKTLSGAFSTLLDNAAAAAAAFGAGGFNDALGQTIALMTEGGSTSNLFATELGGLAADGLNAFNDIIASVGELSGSLDSFLSGSVQDLRAGFAGLQAFGPILKDMFGPFLEIGLKVFGGLSTVIWNFTKKVLGALVQGIDLAVNSFNKLSNLMDGGNRKTDYNTLRDFTDRRDARNSGLVDEAKYQAGERAKAKAKADAEKAAGRDPLGGGYKAAPSAIGPDKEAERKAKKAADDAERERVRAAKERADAAKSLEDDIAGLERKGKNAKLTTLEMERQEYLYDKGLIAQKAGVALDEKRIRAAWSLVDAAKAQADAVEKANDLKQRYDGKAVALNTLNDDRAAIIQSRASGNLGNDQAQRMLAENAKQQRETNFAINQEDRELKRDAIYAMADLFGQSMGDAVARIARVLDSVKLGTFNGSQIGGKAGGVLSAISVFGGDKGSAFVKGIGESFAKTMEAPLGSVSTASKDLMNSFSKGGDALKGIGSAVGTGLAGAETGGMISDGLKGISDALGLGIKISKVGGQIGGAVGAFLPIPFGKEIGAVIGSVIGGLFMKTPKASQTASVDAYGQVVVGKASGDKKLFEGLNQITSAFGDTIKNYQTALGADLAEMTLGSFSSYKGKYGFSINSNTAPKNAQYKSADAQDTLQYALRTAITRGLFTGITEFSQRVLSSAKDLDRAVTLASKYESVVRELANFDDPISAPLGELTKSFQKLRLEMADNGATIDELKNVDRAYDLQRKAITKSQLQDLTEFKKSLSGEGSGVSILSRFRDAQSEFNTLLTSKSNGGEISQADFIAAGTAYNDLAKQVYGTASSQFQNIRQSLITATDGQIASVKATQDATVPVVNAIQTANDDANRNAAAMIAEIRELGGDFRNFFSGALTPFGYTTYINGEAVTA